MLMTLFRSALSRDVVSRWPAMYRVVMPSEVIYAVDESDAPVESGRWYPEKNQYLVCWARAKICVSQQVKICRFDRMLNACCKA